MPHPLEWWHRGRSNDILADRVDRTQEPSGLLRLVAIERPQRHVLEAVREAAWVLGNGVPLDGDPELAAGLVEVAPNTRKETCRFGGVCLRDRCRDAADELVETCTEAHRLIDLTELELPEDHPPQAAQRADRLGECLKGRKRLERQVFHLLRVT